MVTDRTSPARWLAAVEQSGARSSPPASQVQTFEAALERLDQKFYEGARMIGNRTVQLHRMLQEEGIDTGLLDILHGFERIGGDTHLKNYGELCAHYFNLRASGHGHEQTVLALQANREGDRTMIRRCMITAGLTAALCALPVQADQQTKPLFQEVEFIGMVSGKTGDQVTTVLGPPARTEENETLMIWYYEEIVQAMSSRKVFPTTQLVFQDGKVSEVMNTFRSAPAYD